MLYAFKLYNVIYPFTLIKLEKKKNLAQILAFNKYLINKKYWELLLKITATKLVINQAID